MKQKNIDLGLFTEAKLTEGFQSLCFALPRPTRVEERVRRSCIAGATWKLVDEQTAMQHRASARRLDGHADHKAQTAEAGADIKASLREGYSKEVWGNYRCGTNEQATNHRNSHAKTSTQQSLRNTVRYTQRTPPP